MPKHGESRQLVLDAFRNDPDATVRELAERVGLELTTVHYHLIKLEKEGVIRRNHEKRNRTGRYKFHMSQAEVSEIRREAARRSVESRRRKMEEETLIVKRGPKATPAQQRWNQLKRSPNALNMMPRSLKGKEAAKGIEQRIEEIAARANNEAAFRVDASMQVLENGIKLIRRKQTTFVI